MRLLHCAEVLHCRLLLLPDGLRLPRVRLERCLRLLELVPVCRYARVGVRECVCARACVCVCVCGCGYQKCVDGFCVHRRLLLLPDGLCLPRVRLQSRMRLLELVPVSGYAGVCVHVCVCQMNLDEAVGVGAGVRQRGCGRSERAGELLCCVKPTQSGLLKGQILSSIP